VNATVRPSANGAILVSLRRPLAERRKLAATLAADFVGVGQLCVAVLCHEPLHAVAPAPAARRTSSTPASESCSGSSASLLIEKAVRQAVVDHRLKGSERLPTTLTLSIPTVGLTHTIAGDVDLG
jgi:hypothetical protein